MTYILVFFPPCLSFLHVLVPSNALQQHSVYYRSSIIPHAPSTSLDTSKATSKLSPCQAQTKAHPGYHQRDKQVVWAGMLSTAYCSMSLGLDKQRMKDYWWHFKIHCPCNFRCSVRYSVICQLAHLMCLVTYCCSPHLSLGFSLFVNYLLFKRTNLGDFVFPTMAFNRCIPSLSCNLPSWRKVTLLTSVDIHTHLRSHLFFFGLLLSSLLSFQFPASRNRELGDTLRGYQDTASPA